MPDDTMLPHILLLLSLLTVPYCVVKGLDVDPKGYILFCPCMGRFGNQADQFLGVLAFAKSLDRTLVLPPWVEYRFGKPRSTQIPFDTYFKVEPLLEFHRVMTMEMFMEELAPTVWPVGKRTVFCYQARTHKVKANDCNAKEGNPFGPFWDTFNIDFDKSEFYAPLHYDTKNPLEVKRWQDRYGGQSHPVLAFTGAPAKFPIQREHVGLHKYLQWSDAMAQQRDHFIQTEIRQSFIGIHLRLGSDFENACRHLKESPMMFGAAQCVGYRMQHGKPTPEMCYQSYNTIVRDLNTVIKSSGLSTVYIATDSKDLKQKLSETFPEVRFVTNTPPNPHLDLAVLAQADQFIGNCISTFTGFVARERTVNQKPSNYWDFKITKHDEL